MARRKTPEAWKGAGATFVALSLGSNVQPAEANLHAAIDVLNAVAAPLQVAPLYRTAPVSPVPQPDYLNTVVIGRTNLPADGLLAMAKAVELRSGRRRGPRLGPRPLDIDLLLYGRAVSTHPELTLPHPRLRERRFVLAPLGDLIPDWPVPPDDKSISELLIELVDGSRVDRVEWQRDPPTSRSDRGRVWGRSR